MVYGRCGRTKSKSTLWRRCCAIKPTDDKVAERKSAYICPVGTAIVPIRKSVSLQLAKTHPFTSSRALVWSVYGFTHSPCV